MCTVVMKIMHYVCNCGHFVILFQLNSCWIDVLGTNIRFWHYKAGQN